MLSRVEHDKSFIAARLDHANSTDRPFPVYDILQHETLLYYEQTLLFSNGLGSRICTGELCPHTIVNQLGDETCLGQLAIGYLTSRETWLQ